MRSVAVTLDTAAANRERLDRSMQLEPPSGMQLLLKRLDGARKEGIIRCIIRLKHPNALHAGSGDARPSNDFQTRRALESLCIQRHRLTP